MPVSQETNQIVSAPDEIFAIDPELEHFAEKGGILGVNIKQRIPEQIMADVRGILQLVWDIYHTEGTVFVTYDKESKEFGVEIPRQQASASHVTVAEDQVHEVYNNGKILAAWLHSHPFNNADSAFLSATDHNNAQQVKYVPTGSINFRTSPLAQSDKASVFQFGVVKCQFHRCALDQEELAEIPETVVLDQDFYDKWSEEVHNKVNNGVRNTTTGRLTSKADNGKPEKVSRELKKKAHELGRTCIETLAAYNQAHSKYLELDEQAREDEDLSLIAAFEERMPESVNQKAVAEFYKTLSATLLNIDSFDKTKTTALMNIFPRDYLLLLTQDQCDDEVVDSLLHMASEIYQFINSEDELSYELTSSIYKKFMTAGVRLSRNVLIVDSMVNKTPHSFVMWFVMNSAILLCTTSDSWRVST